VRVRINGKGPFNFLVDSGAPALYIATETARKVGLDPAKDDFWTPVDRLEFEGGPRLSGLKARVEDPFQLVGMNALGLPGASIDGILGFTILARFRLEIDPTRDRMTWTKLAYEPKEPRIPKRRPGEKPSPELQAMNMLGPVAKLAALLTGGKQPEEQLHPRGFIGLELDEAAGAGAVRVARVLPDSPAAKAGLRAGDQIVRLLGQEAKSAKITREAVSEVRVGARVPILVRRGAETVALVVVAGEGL
jgi:membrane-associated protease RseP (regulator of RpoE activity)